MPDYKKYKCPVCNKQFKDGDDIVTCPECGTPHHRECYNLTHHCVNQGLHSSGYSFLDSESAKLKQQEQDEIKKSFDGEYSGDYYYSPDDDFVAQAKKEAQEKKSASQNKEESARPAFDITDPKVYNSFKKNIDGYSITDVASAIATNAGRFVKIFEKQSATKKKTGWNWSAFIFGSFYLLFRKMYKQGVAFFCLAMTSIIAGEAFIFKLAPNYIAAIQKFASEYSGNPSSLTAADMQQIMQASDAMTAQKIIYAVMAVLLILRIIEAVFADYFYKKTIINIIDKVTKQLDEGASFAQTPLFFAQDQELNQEQMKRMYLASKGGVTLFAPFLAYFAMYILITYL